MKKESIDNTKVISVYTLGLGILMLVTVLLSTFPELSLSNHFTFYYRKQVSISLFVAGGLFGIGSILSHMQRSKSPWKVPQSKISYYYLLFFVCSLSAILISK